MICTHKCSKYPGSAFKLNVHKIQTEVNLRLRSNCNFYVHFPWANICLQSNENFECACNKSGIGVLAAHYYFFIQFGRPLKKTKISLQFFILLFQEEEKSNTPNTVALTMQLLCILFKYNVRGQGLVIYY